MGFRAPTRLGAGMDSNEIMRPTRYVTRMLVFLAAVAVAAALLYPALSSAFKASVMLNGMILGVAAIGVIYNFRQVITLWPELQWIDSFRRKSLELSERKGPRLLAPMATMIGGRKGDLRLSTTAMRSLLDGINSRLDESRDISRYMIGLLVFLGLLGTFWGLLQTIGSVANVIGSLSLGGGDMSSVFGNLKQGLQAPLTGMGTAFSSSLFGLASSLVLGFLDLQAGQAQNRFYNDLEDWLSGLTRLSSGGPLGEGEQTVPAYIEALLENTAESLLDLQQTIARGEEGRDVANANAVALTEKIGSMTEHMSSEIRLLAKTIAVLAEKQRK